MANPAGALRLFRKVQAKEQTSQRDADLRVHKAALVTLERCTWHNALKIKGDTSDLDNP